MKCETNNNNGVCLGPPKGTDQGDMLKGCPNELTLHFTAVLKKSGDPLWICVRMNTNTKRCLNSHIIIVILNLSFGV